MAEFQVLLTESYEADVVNIFDWLFGYNPVAAFRFRDAVEQASASLAENPMGYPIADESDYYQRTVRRKLFRSGSSTYRLLFTVVELEELSEAHEPTVVVLRVRHGAARPLGDEDSEKE
ncbi:MAG: hypothetical protein OHK0029_14480 [Armatimonadaceae bacterium]